MTRHCSTCGQTIPANSVPVVDLDANKVVMASGDRALTPVMAEVMMVLAEASPRFVSNQEIIKKVWGGTADPDYWKPVYDNISHLRRNLVGTRMTIERRYMRGYRLTAAG